VRIRIAKDLHDDMGSTLSTINILSEMAKTKIDTDIPAAKKFIHQISDNSNRIMESMDDIVWNIDTANESIENTLSRMREFAGNLLEARGVSYIFKEDEQIKNINLELGRRHDFVMIFKEAINNLAKYSECRTASIEVLLTRNTLILLISDDGKGFDHNLMNDGNGLINMQKRAAALKGTLSIKSEINKGTTIGLRIPI
jgi:signal transduction histidine kinase